MATSIINSLTLEPGQSTDIYVHNPTTDVYEMKGSYWVAPDGECNWTAYNGAIKIRHDGALLNKALTSLEKIKKLLHCTNVYLQSTTTTTTTTTSTTKKLRLLVIKLQAQHAILKNICQ